MTTMLSPLPQAVAHPAIEEPWEHMIYWAHVRSADAGLPALLKADIVALLDCADSTVTDVEQRMEAKGWISIARFHRGRRVTITATGKSTAAPKCIRKHWRARPEHQTDPFQLLRLRSPDRAEAVLAAAKREQRSPAAMMMDMIVEALDARRVG